MILSPKETGKYICDHATHVKLNPKGIEKLGDILIEEINSGHLRPDNFSQTDCHPKPGDLNAVDWIFVVDTLNFCFWHFEDKEAWQVEGYSGYYALCAAIKRAIKEGIDILNPNLTATITEEQLRNVLRGDTEVEIPLLPERVRCLHEVSQILIDKFAGSFRNVVITAENSAKTLLSLIVNNFSCFKDEAVFMDRPVSFYKRAQILIGDIWACFKGQGLGYFKDIDDEMTMFADYRVPQTLLWFGVFEYSKHLSDKLKRDILKNGDIEEQEIRGCSIHAVELLKDYANKKLASKATNSVLIDHFLWDFRRKHAQEIANMGLPFHKVFCIYY
ncbi:queuosine salvage protein [Dendroctonus ponderosae]|uniref:Queuosine 5'-phosphate N-glycosylase/hydrolase n=1 Tax=Dendroctonus ponderosae TaxID=77166 RepID=J3JYK8_DENPD|nr:queuosine salvage protein [Dendroctonus ponderosae]AEE63295.1 unknown [Dendroctonus ponderosae]KAH1003862.1 hypothetical protein HUJ04_003711 [Dendroctonus ponderosae]